MDNASSNDVAVGYLKRKLGSRDGNVLSCEFMHVTSNNSFLEISSILCLINEWASSNNMLLRSMAIKMREKFDKYWGDVEKMNKLLFVAMVLDPRYKLKYLKAIFNQVYERSQANRLAEKVKTTLERFFEFYGSVYSTSDSVNTTQNIDVMDVDAQDSASHLSLLKSILNDKLESEEFSDVKSELDKYLDEQREKDVEKFDILNWWKVNSTKYPVLSCIAKDVLAIPVSTVASEYAFSVGGRVLDSFRSSLNPKVVEALICGQDWIRAAPLPLVEENVNDAEKLETEFSNLALGQSGTTTETHFPHCS